MIFISKFAYFSVPSPSTDETHDVKRESEPIFSLYNVNTGSLEDIFSKTPGRTNSPENIDDDGSEDCEMIGEIVPLPLESTSDGLIKKDGDPISNDKPFITSVC